MRVLVACEYSGVVRNAFTARGHDAVSCDLLDSDMPGSHYKCDVRHAILEGWDLMIAHPPCTYLCSSGLHWNKRRPERAQQTGDALAFVQMLLDAPIPRIALENPIGCISTRIRKPDQIIQPWQFGDDASKRTCLWLKNLPKLTPTKKIEPRITVEGKERWGNQSDNGQNVCCDARGKIMAWNNPDTAHIRSKTYAGIAAAMAEQWGALEPLKVNTARVVQ